MLGQKLAMSSTTTSAPTGVDKLIGEQKLVGGDIAVIVVYFVAVIGVGIWVSSF